MKYFIVGLLCIFSLSQCEMPSSNISYEQNKFWKNRVVLEAELLKHFAHECKIYHKFSGGKDIDIYRIHNCNRLLDDIDNISSHLHMIPNDISSHLIFSDEELRRIKSIPGISEVPSISEAEVNYWRSLKSREIDVKNK